MLIDLSLGDVGRARIAIERGHGNPPFWFVRENAKGVAAALDARKVRLVGAMYDVATGKVAFVEP